MVAYLDRAIGKCQEFSKKVEINRMNQKFDEKISDMIPMMTEGFEKRGWAYFFIDRGEKECYSKNLGCEKNSKQSSFISDLKC